VQAASQRGARPPEATRRLCLLVAAYRQMVVACGRGRCPGGSSHQLGAPVRPGPRAAPIAGHMPALAASINAAMGSAPSDLTGPNSQAGQTFWPAWCFWRCIGLTASDLKEWIVTGRRVGGR